MSAVLQSEIRLHEGILASLTLQNSTNGHPPDREEVTARMEGAIANLKDAVRSDEIGAQRERLLHLLFNLQEMISAFKISLQSIPQQEHAADSSALSDGIEWMEDLAETWSLSLDEEFMTDVKKRLVTTPNPASKIRDWREVLGELETDADVQD